MRRGLKKAEDFVHNNEVEVKKTKELLIAAVTPSLLEKGADWFTSNFEKIRQAAKRNPFWQKNTLFLEEGEAWKISLVLRQIIELGYEKTDFVSAPGEFSQAGGFLTIYPVNAKTAYQIEWLGNRIEKISQAKLVPEAPELKPRKGLEELGRLKSGDYVVHLDHGIGRFVGITDKPQRQTTNDKRRKKEENLSFSVFRSSFNDERYFVVEYAPPRTGRDPDRLFLPFAQAKKLSPYSGFEVPAIHRLGSDLWWRTKKRVKEDVMKIAQELLEIYARREIAGRPPYFGDSEAEKSLAMSFPHTETEDQLRAIEEILQDLEEPKPMDRVLVGDVGFGKTEVALRAVFRVVLLERQVVVLAPTTILAWQHAKTFQERLRDFPIRVALLSRLLKKSEQKSVLADLEKGKIDVLIGTHRVLSGDVKFKNLGLLIIDEEQRFGVRAKEHLKRLRPALDILSLSATPIPRTMYLTLSKIRAMSLIQTPPPGRLAIKTFVLPYSKRVIREAIEDELRRNGQIYFLHNRIETMEMRRRELKDLIPKARIGIIHGNLSEKKVIAVMEEFREGKIDVLVATTIIENGLDLSNVNTLIVANSTRLGLGEAYQLRGRIGRGEKQAYAYFLYPARHSYAQALASEPRRALTENSRKRLTALREASHLGAGYEIALKDLEIRGAGNILGKQQSGAINAVGLNLYLQMLSEAVENIQSQ